MLRSCFGDKVLLGIVKLFSLLDELSPPEVLYCVVRSLYSIIGEKEERIFPTCGEK
jgi:hypothetical protein